MELSVTLNGNNHPNELLTLKTFIKRAGIEGLEGVDLARGVGPLDALKANLKKAEKPLFELVKCLQKYADNYRTRVVVKTPGGKDYTLENGKDLRPDQIQAVVDGLLK
ncbi:hypothetical protein [Dinghuibacter silviterrae]|uniref:Uncharacterized protein n=1 Tax=Dinghuibacter silviterrae TaxID=1539049 RepID=A0A4R8DVB8_9BACT|nr:hypothetical protein [Dinghuibacter silviterrae]TDX01415.1 hypothetical protein EDB95_2450 [Dinghuibacter silviterrae]